MTENTIYISKMNKPTASLIYSFSMKASAHILLCFNPSFVNCVVNKNNRAELMAIKGTPSEKVFS